MLRIEHVSKTFHRGTANERKALDDVSLTLPEGEFLVMVGGNGSGKSTIMNVVAGLFPVDEGRLYIGGNDVSGLPEHKRAGRIGRVFQDPMTGTAPNMTIEENLALALRRGKRRGLARGLSKEEKNRYRQVLARLDLGLEDRMGAQVGLLSGGQRQALTLLMATLQRPDILMLDEHTAALDPKTAAKVLQLSDDLVREQRLTTLMVTHNMRDAIRYGDRLVMMEDGRVVYDVKGEEKKKLKVTDLLELFSEIPVA